MAMNFGAAAIVSGAHQGVRCRNPNLMRTTCGSMKDVYLSKKCFLFVSSLKVALSERLIKSPRHMLSWTLV